MKLKSDKLIHFGIALIFAILAIGISSADGANVELVGHLGGNIYDVAVAGNYTYVGQGRDLVVLDITDVSNPSEMGRVITPSIVSGITIVGNYAYVADGDNGLLIMNISDRSSPKIVGNGDIGGSAYSVAVSGNYAHVIGNNGLSIMDLSNSSSPTLAGRYDNGKMSAIAVSGNYAYVISELDSEDESYYSLLIVDATDPSSPILAGSYDLGEGSSVAIADNYAYITDSSGLAIVNITNPSSPTFAGNYDTENFASDVAISGKYAYVAGYGLSILNITDPSSPSLVSSYDTDNAQSVAISGNYAYLVHSVGDISTGFDIVNITDPSVLRLAGSYSTTYNANDVALSGNYAYVADYNNGLVAVDINDPFSPKIKGSTKTENHAYDVDISGNYAYVAESDLVIIDITSPSSPRIVSSYYNSSGDASGVAVSGNYAYIASIFGGLLIVDIRNPSLPTFTGSYATDDAQNVAISGNYAYVANGFGGLLVVDVSNPSSPTLVGSCDTSGYANGIAVSGNYAYVTDGSKGLEIVDISNPSSPALAGSYDTSGYANDVIISGNYAYIADSQNGLVIVNITNPSSPTLAGSYDTDDAFGVAVSDNYAYVADSKNGLFIIHVGTPQDTTPPASVTNLRENSVGSSWINWTWKNPTDVDFSHVMVYLDNLFITNTSGGFYNSTKLTPGTTHTISIKTVDTSGNINTSLVDDVAATILPSDTIPPASVTNLKETGIGTGWVRWTWTNPADADFSHVLIYLNDIFVTNATDKSINSYNATGLSDGITYTISIHTVDISGNINSTWVNDSASTVKLPKISNLSGTYISANSITLAWEASNDTTKVEISRNNVILSNMSGPSFYVDSNLSSGTTYSYTLVPYNKDGLEGKAVSLSLKTSSSSSSGSGGGGGSGASTTSKSTSSGGGGGASSVEDFSNVAMKDVDSEFLVMNSNVTYEFTREGNDIQSVSFYSLKNSGAITSTVEVLNNRSKLVNSNPEGLVYKYMNIWVGKSGFSTEANIKDARVKFKVDSLWLQDRGVNPANVRLQRYNGEVWEVLHTTLKSSNTDYMIFEAQTPGFSPFAITTGGEIESLSGNTNTKLQATGSQDFLNNPVQKGAADLGETQPEKSKTWSLVLLFLLAGVFATGYEYLKRQRD